VSREPIGLIAITLQWDFGFYIRTVLENGVVRPSCAGKAGEKMPFRSWTAATGVLSPIAGLHQIIPGQNAIKRALVLSRELPFVNLGNDVSSCWASSSQHFTDSIDRF